MHVGWCMMGSRAGRRLLLLLHSARTCGMVPVASIWHSAPSYDSHARLLSAHCAGVRCVCAWEGAGGAHGQHRASAARRGAGRRLHAMQACTRTSLSSMLGAKVAMYSS